jgi:hypothetical protein
MNPYSLGGPIGRNIGGGGGAIDFPQVLPGGMPCKFELVMEFVCSFLFTFIIYFCVFAFFPYNGVILNVVNFIKDIVKKITDFFYKLIPNSVKKRASSLFPSFIVKFFKETLPKALSKKKDDTIAPLKKKLEQIREDINKKINNKKKAQGNKGFFSNITLYLNEQYLQITAKLNILWEKFKDKILPAIIISFVYYIIWLIFLKIIPTILKYLVNVAQQFKQP